MARPPARTRPDGEAHELGRASLRLGWSPTTAWNTFEVDDAGDLTAGWPEARVLRSCGHCLRRFAGLAERGSNRGATAAGREIGRQIRRAELSFLRNETKGGT